MPTRKIRSRGRRPESNPFCLVKGEKACMHVMIVANDVALVEVLLLDRTTCRTFPGVSTHPPRFRSRRHLSVASTPSSSRGPTVRSLSHRGWSVHVGVHPQGTVTF